MLNRANRKTLKIPITDPWDERYIYLYIYHRNQLKVGVRIRNTFILWAWMESSLTYFLLVNPTPPWYGLIKSLFLRGVRWGTCRLAELLMIWIRHVFAPFLLGGMAVIPRHPKRYSTFNVLWKGFNSKGKISKRDTRDVFWMKINYKDPSPVVYPCLSFSIHFYLSIPHCGETSKIIIEILPTEEFGKWFNLTVTFFQLGLVDNRSSLPDIP